MRKPTNRPQGKDRPDVVTFQHPVTGVRMTATPEVAAKILGQRVQDRPLPTKPAKEDK